MLLAALRRLVVASFIALIVLGLAWELWLAPLRPGAWALSMKVLPLAIAVPSLLRGHVRAYQWWSMLVLVYLAEGLVRATSDRGPSVPLALVETWLATLAFIGILLYVREARRAARSSASPPAPDRSADRASDRPAPAPANR